MGAPVWSIEQYTERLTIQRDRLASVIKLYQAAIREVASLRRAGESEKNIDIIIALDLVGARDVLQEIADAFSVTSWGPMLNAYEVRPGMTVSDVAGAHAKEGSLFHHWQIFLDLDNGETNTRLSCNSADGVDINVIDDGAAGNYANLVDGAKWLLTNAENPENNGLIEIENDVGSSNTNVKDPEADIFWSTKETHLGTLVDNLEDTKMILRLVELP